MGSARGICVLGLCTGSLYGICVIGVWDPRVESVYWVYVLWNLCTGSGIESVFAECDMWSVHLECGMLLLILFSIMGHGFRFHGFRIMICGFRFICDGGGL